MNPNTDPTNTPPTEGDAPAPEQTPAPEAVTTPEVSTDSAPVTSEAPTSTEAPVAPAAPLGSATPEAPKKKNNVVLLASIIGGVILLAVIGVVVYLAMTTVSKEDYRAAALQFNKVSSANSALNSDVSSAGSTISSASDASFDESMKEIEGSIATLKTENDELAKLKAVRVGEGGDLYNKFNEQLTTYVKYANDIVASTKAVRPAMVECDKVSSATGTSEQVAGMKACAAAMAAVKDLPNQDFQAFISSSAESYNKLATIYEQISKIKDPYGDQYDEYKKLRDQLYDITGNLSKSSREFTAKMRESDTSNSVKDSAKALADYLNAQQR